MPPPGLQPWHPPKCRHFPATLIYELQTMVLPAHGDEPESETSRLHLIGESERTGRDLLAYADDDERTALDEACEFLTAELASGPRPSSDVKKAARAESVSDKTLRRAREKLGIDVKRIGFPSISYWFCSRAPGGLARLESDTEGHDWANPHGDRVFGPSEGLSGPSRALYPDMGTTGLPEAEKEFLEELERVFGPDGARWVK